MGDLAKQICDRLDGLAPQPFTFELPADWTAEQREQFNAEFKATHAAMPPAFIEPAEPLSSEEIERWQEQWEELLPEGARVHTIQILPPGPRFYPGFEQMRAALTAIVDLHVFETERHVDRVPYCAECTRAQGTFVHECGELRLIAEKLGIEVADD